MELTLEQKKALALAQAKRKRTSAPAAAVAPQGNWFDPINAGFHSAVEAVPFVGPQIMGGLEQLKAKVHGTDAQTIHAEEVANRERQPVADIIGKVAGPTLALAPAGMTALGAKALGMTGSLASRIGFGMGSGGLIAGGDHLARGKSVEEAIDAAKWGAGIGAALPAAGAGIKAAWRGATGTAFDPAEKALARALSDDQIPVGDIQPRLDALGPDAVVADLGPNLQRQAGALASLPGDAQKTVRQALADRAAGTNRRIIDDTNATLGPAPVPSRIESGIQGNMDALAPQYRALFQNNARAVDTTALAQNLESEVVNLRGDAQRAVRQVRGMLDIEGVPGELDPNPFTLFQTRQAIDGMIEQEANSKVVAALTAARRQVDAILADAVPGLKQVDAKFEELANQRGALGRGQQTLDSGRTAVRPEELQAEMVQGAVPERGMGPSAVPFRLTQGARAEIERLIGTTANDLNALKSALKGDGSWNRDRLVSLFGEAKADKLLSILEREKTFDATNRIVTQNSETAARGAAQAEVDSGSPRGVRDLTLTGLLASGAQKLANVGARTRRTSTNSKIAEALMARRLSGRTLTAVERAMLDRYGRTWIAPAAPALALTGN